MRTDQRESLKSDIFQRYTQRPCPRLESADGIRPVDDRAVTSVFGD